MLNVIVFVLCASPLWAEPSLDDPHCVIDILQNAPLPPLMVNITYLHIIDPNIKGTTQVRLEQGKMFRTICLGGEFNIPHLDNNGSLSSCYQGNLVTFREINEVLNTTVLVDFSKIECTIEPEVDRYIRTETLHFCERGLRRYTIQYFYGQLRYPTRAIYEICHSDENVANVYAKYKMNEWNGYIGDYISTNYYFDQLFYQSGNVSDIYTNPKRYVENLGVVKYITNDVFLEIAFLAPRDDFLNIHKKIATFHVFNIALQWNTIKEGNWKKVETCLQNLLQTGDFGEVTVYSGTLGVATLPNRFNKPTQLFLKDGKFPVARWFWKFTYSKKTNSGQILFIYNNPYVAKDKVDQEFNTTICKKNVFGDLDWLDEIVDGPFDGFLYACPLDESEIIDPLIAEIVNNSPEAKNSVKLFRSR